VADYTRLIELKVRDDALKRATVRLFRSLERIEKKLDEIGGKGGKGFSKVAKSAENTAKSIQSLEKRTTSVSSAFKRARLDIVTTGAGLWALNKAVTAVDTSFRSTTVAGVKPFAIAANLTTGKLLALKASVLGVVAAHAPLTTAVLTGTAAFVLFGSKTADVGKKLLGITKGLWNAGAAVRKFVEQVKAPGKTELTIFDRIQSAKGGGLIGLQKLLDQVTAAQSRLISTNRGYVASSQQVRAVEKALNAELMARKRVMDQIIMSEQSRTPTSTLTGAAGEAGGLEGLKQLLSEAQGIQDRMLSTNENYKVATARVRNIQKAINQELRQRDLIMGKINIKEEKSVSLGERLRGIGAKLGGQAVQAARPGRGIERRGLMVGGLAGLGGLGMASNTAAGGMLGNLGGAAMGGLGKGMGALGFTTAAKGITDTKMALTGLVGAAKGVAAVNVMNPAFVAALGVAWVAFGNKGIKSAIEKLIKAERFAKKTTASLFEFGKANPAIHKLNMELQLSKDVVKQLGSAVDNTTKKLARMGRNKGNILQNLRASKASRATSGFAQWEAGLAGTGTASARDVMIKSLERKNRRLVQQGKEKLKGERLISKEMKVQVRSAEKLNRTAKQRLKNIRRIRGQKRESLMLGAGFPMLFGGGLGSVAGGVGGSVIGNMMGMGGFGTQIIGSAIGAQLEAVHNRVVEIGNATQTLNLDALEQSGIRVNAELELQIRNLKRIGDVQSAQKAIDKQVFWTTGGTGEVNRDIANNVGALKEAWDGFLAAAGTTLGVVFAPFVTILTGILKLVQGIFWTFNVLASGIGKILKEVTTFFVQKLPFGSKLLEIINKHMTGVNGKLDEMKVKYGEIMQDLEAEKEAILLKLQYGEKEAAIRQRIKDLSHLATTPAEKQALENSIRQIAALNEQWKAQVKIDQMYKQIGQTINDGIVNALEGAIQGTKTLGEVASSVFRSIARMMLQYGVQSFMTSMFPGSKLFGGGMAAGGPVSGNKSYLVGEKGPELFTPTSSGHITPNDQLGGSNIVVNVDASGSAVEGDDQNAQQLGEMLAAAIQSELIKQQRPGGLLR
tara:strand:+ start:2337 stop:5546 length:3210 start_codon:yes stop_codon:yes gene_type:complete